MGRQSHSNFVQLKIISDYWALSTRHKRTRSLLTRNKGTKDNSTIFWVFFGYSTYPTLLMSVEGENEETNPSFLCELESTEEEEIVAHRWWWRWCCCCWWCCCWCWVDGSKLGWDEELVDRMPLGGNWNLLLLSSLGVFVKNRPVLKSVKVLIGELQRTHNKYNGLGLG